MFDNTVMVNDSHVRVHVLTVNNEKQTHQTLNFLYTFEAYKSKS